MTPQPDSVTDEALWDDLLDLIEDRRVIPVIGESLLTFGPEDAPLYAWLARRLEEQLGLPPAAGSSVAACPHCGVAPSGSPEPTLTAVACRHLLANGPRNLIYSRLTRVLHSAALTPGSALRALATVTDFNLFITTGFDSLLLQALDAARHHGQPLTRSFAYSPGAETKDLPSRKRDLIHPVIYHILGKATTTPDYAVWEEDALEFICQLHNHMPVMPHLARDLNEHSLLVLGLNFSDWLVRFFLRVAKQDALSRIQTHNSLAEGPPCSVPESMVMFFGGVSRNIHIVRCDPVEFAIELARRWQARRPPLPVSHDSPPPLSAPSRLVPDGAIFISYAREDESAVRMLKYRLEAAGCIVWFDQDPDRNRSGEDYERNMEDAIKHNCTAFISVISRTTEHGREERSCFRERNWAEERSDSFPGREGFYFPVVIDDANLPPRREPTAFASRHIEPTPGGQATEAFCRRLFEIQTLRLRERHAAIPHP
ncbi:MAG: toll/interleukin-1 receptor domain-containing protein [Verrucomicrobia bacterium]|nr:toll/interleukin-1 receptor domain-containing protein [Verrucomicrobiota bacterium]